ncbi:MAG: ABC transporter permease [Ferruginibacter sp.]
MLKNYFKIAWRNLMKNKVFSFINIFGLTIGITVCMMIFLFIMNEYSVDNFHKNGKNIYRVMRGFDDNGSMKTVSYLSGPYAPALLNDFKGQILKAVRVQPTNGLIAFDNKSFNEKKIYLADVDFFDLFSFPLIKGNAVTVLKDPGSVVLTETTAKKYFGNINDAMGKIINLDKQLPLKVTGIAKDIPSNSHLAFDMVIPISHYINQEGFNVWINNRLFTYIMLAPNVRQTTIDNQLPVFIKKYMGADMKKFGFHFTVSLTPLKDVYFENADFDNVRHGSKTVVYIFLSIAILILLIACINFTNLSTVRAIERSKEVGLRKVLGALRNHLVWQFIGESILLTIISCILAIGLLFILMPFYSRLLGYTLTVSWNTMPLYLFLAGIIIIVGLVAGSYPAFVLSAFQPIQALKGKLKLGKGGSLFRQTLVIVQFSISVLLIIGTIIIMNQMSYLKNKQLGYNQEQTVVVPLTNGDIYDNLNVFKNDLQNESNVSSVSMMSGEPGGFFDAHMFEVEGQNDKWISRTEFSDFQFVKTLGLKIIAGRDFSPEYPTDTTKAVLINRTAAAKLGWTPEQAIGKWIKNTVRDDEKRIVIGVIADFNFLSLKENINALVISPAMDRRVALIKLKAGNIESSLAAIKKDYSKAAPVYPFEYSFLDEKFDELYKTDIRQQTILGIFSGLAILIACLGLFGLASFTAAKRIKEIGVRKVLGSSTRGVVLLLSKDMLKPVIISIIIAIPIGYYAMSKWLQNFAYRTPLHWWIFILAAAITFGIALFTISFKAVKAAMANPAKSLRAE